MTFLRALLIIILTVEASFAFTAWVFWAKGVPLGHYGVDFFYCRCGYNYSSTINEAKMTIEEKLEKALDLLRRVVFSETEIPDRDWLKDYFLLTGEYMILCGEHGWVPGNSDISKENILEVVNEASVNL